MNLETILAPLRQLWARQTAREQALLALCGGLIVLVLVWFLVLSPALSYRNAMRASFEAQLEDHLALVGGIERYRALAAASEAEAGSAAPLRTLVGASAREAGVAITRVQPLEDGQLSVWVDRVQEAELMAFLIGLSEAEGVRVTRMSLDREGDGLVRAQMVLARPGGAA